MGTPDPSKPRINPLLDEDDFRIAAPPPVQERAVPEYIAKHLRVAEEKVARDVKEPDRPRLSMLSGVFLFPFQLKSLEALIFSTVGLLVGGWLLMFWIAYGAIGGTTTVYYIGVPTCATIITTLGYIATCSLKIIESTAENDESFEIAVGIEWKEWIWNFAHMLVLVLQAGMVGAVMKVLIPIHPWLPMIAATYAVFPIVLLGALAADGAWAPIAIGSVLRSLIPVGWAWALFYLETTVPIVAWCILVGAGLSSYSPWLTPLYAAPLLAIYFLFYARLIGRLASCISESTKNQQSEGDDDEE
jgi:hypothetical protein